MRDKKDSMTASAVAPRSLPVPGAPSPADRQAALTLFADATEASPPCFRSHPRPQQLPHPSTLFEVELPAQLCKWAMLSERRERDAPRSTSCRAEAWNSWLPTAAEPGPDEEEEDDNDDDGEEGEALGPAELDTVGPAEPEARGACTGVEACAKAQASVAGTRPASCTPEMPHVTSSDA
jgi:hypothetical protein